MKFFKNARNLWEWLEYWGGFIFIRYRLNKYSMDEGVADNTPPFYDSFSFIRLKLTNKFIENYSWPLILISNFN